MIRPGQQLIKEQLYDRPLTGDSFYAAQRALLLRTGMEDLIFFSLKFKITWRFPGQKLMEEEQMISEDRLHSHSMENMQWQDIQKVLAGARMHFYPSLIRMEVLHGQKDTVEQE